MVKGLNMKYEAIMDNKEKYLPTVEEKEEYEEMMSEIDSWYSHSGPQIILDQ